jgi:predicted site-specific integrase-resolvase
MKLAVWVRADGVHPQTAYRWFRQGTIPIPAWQLPSGTILVDATGSSPYRQVVEHRHRLARFGVQQLEAALSAQGCRLLVVDPGGTSDDLMQDILGVLTGFCARLYGRRGAHNRALRAVTCAKRPPEFTGVAVG